MESRVCGATFVAWSQMRTMGSLLIEMHHRVSYMQPCITRAPASPGGSTRVEHGSLRVASPRYVVPWYRAAVPYIVTSRLQSTCCSAKAASAVNSRPGESAQNAQHAQRATQAELGYCMRSAQEHRTPWRRHQVPQCETRRFQNSFTVDLAMRTTTNEESPSRPHLERSCVPCCAPPRQAQSSPQLLTTVYDI